MQHFCIPDNLEMCSWTQQEAQIHISVTSCSAPTLRLLEQTRSLFFAWGIYSNAAVLESNRTLIWCRNHWTFKARSNKQLEQLDTNSLHHPLASYQFCYDQIVCPKRYKVGEHEPCGDSHGCENIEQSTSKYSECIFLNTNHGSSPQSIYLSRFCNDSPGLVVTWYSCQKEHRTGLLNPINRWHAYICKKGTWEKEEQQTRYSCVGKIIYRRQFFSRWQ